MFWIVVDGVRIATFSTLGRHESHEREIDAVNKGGFSVDLEIVLISKRKSKKLSTTFKQHDVKLIQSLKISFTLLKTVKNRNNNRSYSYKT
jgi:hypothetical protein